jgi:hypothetical protein
VQYWQFRLYFSGGDELFFSDRGRVIIGMLGNDKDQLERQVPEYGLEALISTIDDRDELISAIKESRKH